MCAAAGGEGAGAAAAAAAPVDAAGVVGVSIDVAGGLAIDEPIRRAVRIAPLGVAPPMSRAPLGDELTKGKRRGSVATTTTTTTSGAAAAGTPVAASAADAEDPSLTPEERMKQKRMLRNRESAARSRDKRRTRNAQLQADIARRRQRIATLDALHAELQIHVKNALSHLDLHSSSSQ